MIRLAASRWKMDKKALSLTLSLTMAESDAILAQLKNSEYIRAELAKPSRPRSTGERSQNNHTHGHYQDIAEQLSGEVVYTTEQIGIAMKKLAMKANHWPPIKDGLGRLKVNPVSKELEPISESDATSEQIATLINYIHWWADTNGLWLTEYIDGKPQKVYGGGNVQQQGA